MGGGQWSTMRIPRFFTKTLKIGYYLPRRVGVSLLVVVTLLGISATPVLADIPTNSSVISIEGHGWGHGVGMSQYGAYSRALSVEEGGGGQTAEQILSFYYPGTTLSDVDTLNDLSVHIFSGEGATFTTSGPIDLVNASGNVFANIPAATVLTVVRSADIISISTPDNIDHCIESAQPENIQHCADGPISIDLIEGCLLYTSPSPRDLSTSRMPSSA